MSCYVQSCPVMSVSSERSEAAAVTGPRHGLAVSPSLSLSPLMATQTLSVCPLSSTGSKKLNELCILSCLRNSYGGMEGNAGYGGPGQYTVNITRSRWADQGSGVHNTITSISPSAPTMISQHYANKQQKQPIQVESPETDLPKT